jgi:nucleotide-binding universal stress UspA family protein
MEKEHAAMSRVEKELAGVSVPPLQARLYQDLLVYQDESAAALNAFDYALALSQSADGNLAGLMFGFLASYPVNVYMEATPDLWLAAQRKATEEADAAEKRIAARIERADAKIELRRKDVMGGEAGRTLAVHARYADAVVLGWSEGKGTDFERQLLEAVLFEAGRPIIVVPEGWRGRGAPRRILLAWTPEREATRAVHDALPLMKSADEVSVLAVVSNGGGSEENPGADIARHLARHDVAAKVNQVPAGGRAAAAVIADQARYLEAEMVVMGGYGHSRFSEWIFGGATRDMLAKVDAPLLMSH